MISFKDLCIDATHPEVLARFWAAALGLRAESTGGDFRLVGEVPEHTLWVNKVPEPRSVKQRVHIDVHVKPLAVGGTAPNEYIDVHVAAVSDLIKLGAIIVDEAQPWTVLADPEGGELCAFVRDPDALPDYRIYEVVVDAADPVTIASWWADRYNAASIRPECITLRTRRIMIAKMINPHKMLLISPSVELPTKENR